MQISLIFKHLNPAILAVAMMAVGNAHAQSPAIEWETMVGDSGSEQVTAIIATVDSGYLAVGTTGLYSGSHGGQDGFVSKLNAAGERTWQLRLGRSNDDVLSTAIQMRDGGYLVGGRSYSTDQDAGEGGGTMWIVKLNSAGSVVWDKRYGGSCSETVVEIDQDADDGFFLVGGTCSNDGDVTGYHPKGLGGNGDPTTDAWIVKIDSTGNLMWQKCLGGSQDDGLGSLIQTADGGYFLCGNTYSNDGDIVTGNHGHSDVWIVKLDSGRTITWSKTYGGSEDESAVTAIKTVNGYTALCTTDSYDGDISDTSRGQKIWILYLDSDGGITYQSTRKNVDSNSTLGILTPLVKGRTLLCGENYAAGQFAGTWLSEFDTASGYIWIKTFFGGQNVGNFFNTAIRCSDGSYVVGGQKNDSSSTAKFTFAWVVKLAPVPSGVAEQPTAADIISYASSSPNPTGEGTVITFGLSKEAYVKINLFDILGHEVTSPGFEGLFAPGNHEVPLSLQNLPSGTYFARILTAYGNVATVKLVKE